MSFYDCLHRRLLLSCKYTLTYRTTDLVLVFSNNETWSLSFDKFDIHHLRVKHQALIFIYSIFFDGSMAMILFKHTNTKFRGIRFVCSLFVWGISPHSRIFQSYWDVTITGEGLHFDLCSASMAIDQWMFFSVPHLLWHGASVYNGHLRVPITITSIAERLAVELSLPVFTT